MRNKTDDVRNAGATLAVVLGLSVLPVGSVVADDHRPWIQPNVVAPEESVLGMTYGDWSAAWWQYVLSINKASNPVWDTAGFNCGVGQSAGPVFFLVGAATDAEITRSCTIPAGKVLVIPIINVECSTVESAPFLGSNGQELRTCAAAFVDGVGKNTLKVTIDYKSVRDVHEFRVQSPVFNFVMPADDNYLDLPGVTSGASLSDGYWLILKPLSPGHHVIHLEGAYVSGPGAGFSQNVTYDLTVQR